MKKQKNKILIALYVVLLLAVVGGCFLFRDKITSKIYRQQSQQEKALQLGKRGENKKAAKAPIINKKGNTVATRFQAPPGYARKESPTGFAKFLEEYPVYKDGKKVLYYNKQLKANQGAVAAVVKMPLVPGNLQQCADSVIRLYAEYFYKTGQYSKMNFHLVNGFAVSYAKWKQGYRVLVDGNSTTWAKTTQVSNSRQTFTQYLRFVFAYASTLSMAKESKKIDVKEIKAGDIFIYGGSPGHVVMVMDVCKNKKGEIAFLLGQGFMPAQQFHILTNPKHENDPWYYTKELIYPFTTAEFTFARGSLKRPKYN